MPNPCAQRDNCITAQTVSPASGSISTGFSALWRKAGAYDPQPTWPRRRVAPPWVAGVNRDIKHERG